MRWNDMQWNVVSQGSSYLDQVRMCGMTIPGKGTRLETDGQMSSSVSLSVILPEFLPRLLFMLYNRRDPGIKVTREGRGSGGRRGVSK